MISSFLDPTAVEKAQTLDEVAKYRAEAKRHSKPWHENIRLWRRLYDFDHYCLVPGTRVLTRDLNWVFVEDLDIGDELIAFDEGGQPGQGYRNWKSAIVTGTGFDRRECTKLTLDDGTIVTATNDHKWLARNRGGSNIVWRKSEEFLPGDKIIKVMEPWEHKRDYVSGYLSAAFDGEGCVTGVNNSASYRLQFAQKDNCMLLKVAEYLNEIGIYYTREVRSSGVTTLAVNRKANVFRLLGEIRPERLLQKFLEWPVHGRLSVLSNPTVVAVESVGEQEVVLLGTDAETYIAEGLCAHNTGTAKPGEERYPDPTPTNVTDLAVGIIMANGLEFRAMGFHPSAKERGDTSRIEKFLVGVVDVSSEREGYDIPYEAILNATRDGASVLYTVWDPVLDKSEATMAEHPKTGEQVKAYKSPPLCMKVFDPLEIEFIPGGKGGFDHIFRAVQMTPYQVEQEFGVRLEKFANWTQLQKMDPTSKHELVNYWRRVEIEMEEPATMQLGEPEPEANSIRRLVIQQALLYANEVIWPLKIADGYEDIPITIGKFKPIKKLDPAGFHGIIRPLESTVTQLERAVNRRAYQIKVYTALPMIARVGMGRQIDIDPGLVKVVEMTADEGLEFPKWPGNPPDVEEQINYMRARLQQSGFADVMFGAGTGQVAGYALSQMGDQNRIRLEQPVRHLERMWSEWGRKVMRLISVFGQGAMIRVYGRMRGQDFMEQIFGEEVADYLIRSYIKPKFPNDQVRNHAMATQAAPWLSPWTIMERYLDIEQPDDEVDKQIQYQATQHPAFQQYAVMAALTEAAEEGDEIAAQVLAQMNSGGIMGEPGRPPGPRKPEQPMGLQGPTGQATPQAGGGAAPGQSSGDMMDQLASAAPGMDGSIG